MNRYKIREYKKGDYEKILPLWKELGLGDEKRGDNEDIILQTIKSGGKFFILYDSIDNKIIGTSWITNDKRRLYLHHFGIAKQYQKQGLSHILMKKSMEFAKTTKLQIKLEVHKNNLVAINLYRKYGFKYLGDYLVYIIRNYNEI